MSTNFSKRTWILLWICLIFINVIMRIPVTPHEIGHDSFMEHFISDSLSINGYARWLLHPLSIIDMYPFSTASALPFYLSGVSQSISMPMEWTMWIALLLLGIFSSFTAYLMAGAIRDDKLFKFITAFVYSTSPGILVYTTWNATGRGLFLVLLPLFIYLLLKSRFSKFKFSLLCFILLILILATHNLFYITIPIIISYLIVKTTSNFQIKASNLFIGIISLILFITFYIQYNLANVSVIILILNFARYIGVLGFFVIGGFLSLLLKNNKTPEEKFLLIILFLLLPTLSLLIYSKYFMLPFEALLISYGIINLTTISKKRNSALFIIFILFMFSVGFAEYFQFNKINNDEGQVGTVWAEDSTINAAIWTRSYTNNLVFTDEITLSRRILAYSGAQMFTADDLVYNIQDNLGTFNISMRSPFTRTFYGEGPFEVQNRTGLKSWSWYKLRDNGLDTKWGDLIVENIDIGYYIRNERFDSTFSRSFKDRSKLYDVGKISIWDFKN